MNTSSPTPLTDRALKQPNGRVYRPRSFGWSLMNREHFQWLIRVWWTRGYEAGLAEAAAAISERGSSQAPQRLG